MRRGSSLNHGAKERRAPVSADLHDLEGGGASSSSYGAPSSSPAPISRGSSGSLSTSDLDLYSSDDAKKNARQNVSRAYFANSSPDSLRGIGAALVIGTFVIFPFLPLKWSIFLLVIGSCCFGGIASLWLSRSVLQCDEGTAEMRAVSDPIREGAEGFLRVQYTAIASFAVPLSVLIFVSYQFRPKADDPVGVALLGNSMLGIVAALGFAFGAVCSAVSGYISMWVAAQSNIRVASAGRRTYGEALIVCFRGGAFSAVLNLTLCIAGITSLYLVLHTFFVQFGGSLSSTDIPMLLVGYGFGASFVALFMQLGGGIYTKAADVGADLVGKVEQSIPEDGTYVARPIAKKIMQLNKTLTFVNFRPEKSGNNC